VSELCLMKVFEGHDGTALAVLDSVPLVGLVVAISAMALASFRKH
jgi:hypothetical protein